MADRKTSSLTSELLLKKKKIRTESIDITIDGEKYPWKFRAISGNRLDALQSKFPPNKEQKARGLSFNVEKFGPALLSACSIEPVLSPEEAEELWSSEEWTSGELNTLFNTCINLCMNGIEVNPTERA